MPAKDSDSKTAPFEAGSDADTAGALFESVLESLVTAGLVQFDSHGDWKLSALGESAMARYYRQLDDSSWGFEAATTSGRWGQLH
jgi:hypothetical protein